MLVDNSLVFDNNVFEINEDPIITTIDTEIAKITTIDNFYKDIDGVTAQLPKMPISLIWEQPDNNKTFIIINVFKLSYSWMRYNNYF